MDPPYGSIIYTKGALESRFFFDTPRALHRGYEQGRCRGAEEFSRLHTLLQISMEVERGPLQDYCAPCRALYELPC